jgi:hypothetical protein
MLLATFQQIRDNCIMWLIIVIAFYSWVAKKYVANNPGVKDAAKKAASKKAISLISKWLK